MNDQPWLPIHADHRFLIWFEFGGVSYRGEAVVRRGVEAVVEFSPVIHEDLREAIGEHLVDWRLEVALCLGGAGCQWEFEEGE